MGFGSLRSKDTSLLHNVDCLMAIILSGYVTVQCCSSWVISYHKHCVLGC